MYFNNLREVKNSLVYKQGTFVVDMYDENLNYKGTYPLYKIVPIEQRDKIKITVDKL